MKASFRGFSRYIVRTALAVMACALLVMGTAAPAFAFGSSPSSPSKGVAEMNDLQAESKQAVEAEPRDLKEIQGKAKRGINEVQGRAGMEKMNTPVDSQEATTVREQVENALERITPE